MELVDKLRQGQGLMVADVMDGASSALVDLIRQATHPDVSKAERQRPSGAYCANVAHITFNAWHYLDSNLWASLALRIFEGLAETLSGSGPAESEIARVKRELGVTIASNQRSRAEAENAVSAAEEARRHSEAELAELRADRVGLAKNVKILDLVDEPWRKEAKKWACSLGQVEPKDLEELERSFEQARQTAGSLEVLLPGFMLRLPGWQRLSIAVLGGLSISGLLLAWDGIILPHIQTWIGTWFHVPALGSGVTAAAGAATWVANRLGTAKKAQGKFNELLDRMRQAQAKAEKRHLDGPLAKVMEKDAEIAAQRQRIEQADKDIAAAAARLQQVDAGVLVYEFLNQRIADSRYVGSTGIISTLRQDLETLESKLGDWAKEKEQPRLERIVLYIDDLDRCDPERVVEVLQAIHLLLAFKLFAVVVAVDPRWLERSLYKRYLPGFEEMNEQQRAASEFSPHNYLEKIFQVPYRVQAMQKAGFTALVEGLVPKPLPAPESGSGEKTWGTGKQNDDARQNAGEGSDKEKSSATAPQAAAKAAPAAEAPPRLELSPHETELLSAVQCFIQTPRAAKRLVNVYVLIRLQVSAAADGLLEQMRDPAEDSSKALVTLLAIDIGFSQVGRLLRGELPGHDGDLLHLIHTLRGEFGDDHPDLHRELTELEDALNDLEPVPPMTRLREWLPYVDRFSFHEPEDRRTIAARWNRVKRKETVDA